MATSRYVTVIPHGKQREDTPDWRDLHSSVVSQYAVHWEAIGAELGLEYYHIANISEDHHNRTEKGCTAMLMKWLQLGDSPTWGRLDDAINKIIKQKDSSLLFSGDSINNSKPVGTIVNLEYSSNLKEHYVTTRFSVEIDAWPPDQPKEYATLALIHHKNQPTQKQLLSLAKEKATGQVDSIVAATSGQFRSDNQDSEDLAECLQESKSTRNITEILAPLENPDEEQPRTVLIEGAPGLGKTVLLKQIAYEWAKGKQLHKSELVFLLFLRDPTVREMSSMTDLVQYFSTKSTETCKIHADYISETNGKNITFLLDGYDELPSQKREDSFIAKIIQHKILPLSAVIISSRPHASTVLRKNALCQVDILGFTNDDQLLFFQTALKDQPHKLQHLLCYLEDHPAIRSLCYIPFTITVLLWLFKQGIILPSSSTELYNYFICHTIRHHLAKHDIPCNNVTDLNSLPQPYKKIMQQLSVLCLKALETNDLVFSLQDIKQACPEIDTFPGAINAFGLLQAVEHYSQDPKLMGTTIKTLNFIHFSIQEYLAAYQITCLPPKTELEFIKTNFLSEFYINTFALYVGMTKGQRPCFKKFLSSYGKNFISSFISTNTNKITSKFLKDDRKSLRLFQCFHEADDQEACKNVTDKIYSKNEIDLQQIDHDKLSRLPPSDVHCLALLLSKSPNKYWKMLKLVDCYIGDAGLQMLHQSLITNGITIDEINLQTNSLTSQSSEIMAEIIHSCKIIKLNVSGNTFTNLDLSNCSTLQELIISHNNMSSSEASRLFVTLQSNKSSQLRKLWINWNKIDDEAVHDITQFLMGNDVLEILNIVHNKFSVQGIVKILTSLQNNKTLKELRVDSRIKYNLQVTAKIKELKNRENLTITFGYIS